LLARSIVVTTRYFRERITRLYRGRPAAVNMASATFRPGDGSHRRAILTPVAASTAIPARLAAVSTIFSTPAGAAANAANSTAANGG
jgi:hypothetical protein